MHAAYRVSQDGNPQSAAIAITGAGALVSRAVGRALGLQA